MSIVQTKFHKTERKKNWQRRFEIKKTYKLFTQKNVSHLSQFMELTEMDQKYY